MSLPKTHSSDIQAKAPQGGKAPGDLPCALSDPATTACSLADKAFRSSDENRHQLAGVPPDRLGVSSVSQDRFQRLCSASALYRAFLPSLLRQVAAGPNDFCGKRTTRRTADVGIFAGSYPGRVGCRNMSGTRKTVLGLGRILPISTVMFGAGLIGVSFSRSLLLSVLAHLPEARYFSEIVQDIETVSWDRFHQGIEILQCNSWEEWSWRRALSAKEWN